MSSHTLAVRRAKGKTFLNSFNCKLLFEIVDAKHIAELRDDTWHEAGHAVDPSNYLGSQQQEKKRSMEQDAFRRIRYFCEIQVRG